MQKKCRKLQKRAETVQTNCRNVPETCRNVQKRAEKVQKSAETCRNVQKRLADFRHCFSVRGQSPNRAPPISGHGDFHVSPICVESTLRFQCASRLNSWVVGLDATTQLRCMPSPNRHQVFVVFPICRVWQSQSTPKFASHTHCFLLSSVLPSKSVEYLIDFRREALPPLQVGLS